MLFKKGLTRGLHRSVLEQTNPHPTMLRGWIEAAWRQYKLYAKIKASMGSEFGRPQVTQNKSNRWRTTLGKKTHPWSRVPKCDHMDLDAATVNALSIDERNKLQKEGRCFHCKRLGHVS
jgi:hypothetical protein